ncbi:MAG: NTP transferase domain-containing protein [Rickettsiales bacterium]|nr:NTP transferase domain-containing protein [Rickettsiales bacterium]
MNVLILAGERPEGDPLAHAEGVASKCDILIAGKTMLQHVMSALSGLTPTPVVFISSNQPVCAGVIRIPTAATPCTSVLDAIRKTDFPVLITTADHPLLTPDIMADFLTQAALTTADVVVGVVELERVMTAYPQSRRTRLRFRDGSISGANLFLLRNKNAEKLIDFWRQVEANRKSPLRMLRVLGVGTMLRFALGLLRFSEVVDIIEQRTDVHIATVRLSDPHAAIDVDKAEDLALVRHIFAARVIAAEKQA